MRLLTTLNLHTATYLITEVTRRGFSEHGHSSTWAVVLEDPIEREFCAARI
jgi:hypothetical protein